MANLRSITFNGDTSTIPEIDTTLSVAGKVADAKAVGDAIESKADLTDLAPEYDATSTYSVGDYVIYNGDVYRCTTAITTAEAWTAAHWTQVSVGEELYNVKQEFRQLSDDVDGKLDAPETAGTSGQVLTSDGQGGQTWETPSSPPVSDVQINGTSILSQGVANITPPSLDFVEQVSGTTPTITAMSGVRYICGEVATLSITPPASGCCDIVFESGSTPTVLTVPNTVKWANGFNPTSLEANTTYEINIMDGLGVAMAWT